MPSTAARAASALEITSGSSGSLPPKSSRKRSIPSMQSSSAHSLTRKRNGSLTARQLVPSIFPAPETATLYQPESAFCTASMSRFSPLKPDISVHVMLSVECHHLYSKGSANVPSLVKLAVRVVAPFSHTSVSPSIATGGAQR